MTLKIEVVGKMNIPKYIFHNECYKAYYDILSYLHAIIDGTTLLFFINGPESGNYKLYIIIWKKYDKSPYPV